ncbi:hypothetical protein ZIOFF_068108 [Zingiber officinale]|uniref:Reverse transcriptase n=1 Tax=Zingiber officinale TaxID=94328 RepID=A0A8J5EEG6_ZINOF|nr:hypothetical protein ZIOFF_068108 [Zingiber officinale]
MNLPPRFVGDTGNRICKLRKTLYGLKQSPKTWFGRFANVMKKSREDSMDPNHKIRGAMEEPIVHKRM